MTETSDQSRSECRRAWIERVQSVSSLLPVVPCLGPSRSILVASPREMRARKDPSSETSSATNVDRSVNVDGVDHSSERAPAHCSKIPRPDVTQQAMVPTRHEWDYVVLQTIRCKYLRAIERNPPCILRKVQRACMKQSCARQSCNKSVWK